MRGEGYVMMACIALGMLQIMAMKFGTLISMTSFLYLRTQTSRIPSELTMTRFFNKTIFRVIEKHRHLGIYQIIRNKQESSDSLEYLDGS